MNSSQHSPFYKKAVLLLLPASILVAGVLLFAYKFAKAGFSAAALVQLMQAYPKAFAFDWAAGSGLLFTTAVLLLVIARKRNNVLASFSIYILLSMLALLLTVFLTLVQYGMDTAQTYAWIVNHPYHFAMSAAFILSVVFFLLALLGSYYIAAVLSVLLLGGIGTAHYIKLKILGEPLYPTDLKQVKQLNELVPMVANHITFSKVAAAILILAAIFFVWKRLPRHRMHKAHRLLLLIASGMLVWSYYNFNSSFLSSLTRKANITFIPWDQAANYQLNGFILGLAANLHQEIIEKPDGYSRDSVMKAARKAVGEAPAAEAAQAAAKKPNVIYIMSEAFWDPTRLENVSFSADPIPFVHSLERSGIHGNVLSPSRGGGTANVEFEALTGFSMSFLMQGSTPYQQVIEDQDFIPTIVSAMEEQDYKTIALHPFNKYFYKRNRVYDTFGFDTFISMTEIKHKELSGTYISDMSVSKELLDLLKDSEKPAFIHTVTMQNHFPYNPGYYPNAQVKVQGLSEEHKKSLETYTEGVRQADAAFRYLMEELNKLDEPTMVVLWGDHQPALGVNSSLYVEAKFMTSGKSADEIKRMHETPLVITANFPLPSKDLGTISPIYLNGTVLSLLGEKVPPYYRFLQQLQKELPGLRLDLKFGPDQQPLPQLTKQQQKLLDTYKLLQYDLLVGKQYSKDILFSAD